MTLNQFKIFVAIARHHNITKASAELRLSQPWVSQQLQLLEENCGAKLCERFVRGIELTEAGEIFLEKLMPILERVAQLKIGFQPPTQQPQPAVLRVGGTFSSSAILLPGVLARIQRNHPQLIFELRTLAPEDLERLVSTSLMEIAVSTHAARSPELVSEAFGREKMVMFVASSHHLAKKPKLTMSDVLVEPLVIRGVSGERGTIDRLLRRLKAQGASFTVGMRCDEPSKVMAAVGKKMGIGILFEDVLKSEAKMDEFKILNVPGLHLEGESFIIYPRYKALPPLACEFLELLRCARPKSQAIESAAIQPAAINSRSRGVLPAREKLVWQTPSL